MLKLNLSDLLYLRFKRKRKA